MIRPVLAARRTIGSVLAAEYVVAEEGMPSLYNDLVSFWNLEEASGQRNDSYGANHLTDVNTVTQAAGVSAETGFAAQFVRANSEYLLAAAPDPLQPGTSDFAIAGWLYFDSIASNQTFACTGATSSSSSSPGFWILISPTTSLAINFDDEGASYRVRADLPYVFSISTWYFIVANFDRDSVATVFINTVSIGTLDISERQLGANGTYFSLGGTGTGSLCLNGRMDAAGYWIGRIITTEEIAYLYNTGLGRQYPL